jgi:hypothetical protein
MKKSVMHWKRGYLWVTLAFFALSVAGHWIFAWFDYREEQLAHGETIEVSGYVVKTLEATFENWQSEFLQLIWQVVGLALLLYVGSPQSKEGDERMEAKLDWIMKQMDPQDAEKMMRQLAKRYPQE